METVVYIKRENQTPVAVRLKTVRQNGQWLALAEIPTRTGPIRLTAMASEQTVMDLIQRGVAKLPTAVAAGADIVSTVARLAQSKAAQNVLKQAQNVVKNPLFMTALSFIPGFGPAMGVMSKATQAVQAAENLMGRARQGDGKAQKSVGIIASAAKKGSKKGTVLLALLQAADGIRSMFSSGNGATEVDDITQYAGWSPPWGSPSASSGNSWTPPWGTTAPNPPPPASTMMRQPPGWPQLPPQGFSPPGQWTPPQPQGMPPSAPMPYGWPPQYPNGWPWFTRSTPKC
jgi:hypothetical protein